VAIWRLYGSSILGNAAQGPVHFLDQERSFQPVNLLEKDQRQGEQKMLHMKPHEISTLKLRIR